LVADLSLDKEVLKALISKKKRMEMQRTLVSQLDGRPGEDHRPADEHNGNVPTAVRPNEFAETLKSSVMTG